jgi:hypothetical protein
MRSADKETFESSPAMLASAKMGLFGPAAQDRAEAFASQLGQTDVERIRILNKLADGATNDVQENSPKLTTNNYLQILQTWRNALSGKYTDIINQRDPEKFQRWSNETTHHWARLRQARIFDLSVWSYAQAHHMADRYTCEVLAGVPWSEYDVGKPPSKEENGKVSEMYLRTANTEWWFDHLPFETCYLGFGQGAVLSPLSHSIRGDRYNQAEGEGVVLGILISDADRSVTEICVFVDPESGGAVVAHYPLCVNGVWENSMTLSRWMLPMLVDLINENRTLIIESKPSFSDRRDWKKSGKKMKVRQFFPRPYYTVKLRQQVIDDSLRKTTRSFVATERILTYRHDVRGHECAKVQRGVLPLSAKDEKALLKKGYRVYTQRDRITTEDYARLMERSHELLRQGEWIAVKSWWKAPFVRGPEDAPYIPAVRTLGKKKSGGRPRRATAKV